MLYTHPDLVVNEYGNKERRLLLLGDMFDYADPDKNNQGILQDLSAVHFTALFEKIAKYSGKYVLIWIEKGQINLIHDAFAARKIYYTKGNGEPWISSHSHLLARVSGLKRSADPSRQSFYDSPGYARLFHANLGNTTSYDEIHQLMPNHYFDLNENRAIRYWPTKVMERIGFDECVNQCSMLIKGYMESITRRYKVMLPVTSGGDSRLLMAATRPMQGDVYYYVNRNKDFTDSNPDIRIPAKLFNQLGLNFNIVNLPSVIDPAFEKVYLENNPMAYRFFLPHIYNYYLHFQDRVNLPGNIISAAWGHSQLNPRRITVEELVGFNGARIYGFTRDYFQNWFSTSKPLCQTYNVSLITLFYWEERLANWGTQIGLDKEIAQEEFNLFNSRLLIELFLSIPNRDTRKPIQKWHNSIIRMLWPELMGQPFNPSLSKEIMTLLSYLGINTFINRAYYRIKHL